MMEEKKHNLFKITFDGIEVEVEPGTTIMQAARRIAEADASQGHLVPPAMCYYKPLEGSGGKCRACLVRVAQGSAKDTRPMPKLVPSCITQVQDGMVVENATNPAVLEERKGDRGVSATQPPARLPCLRSGRRMPFAGFCLRARLIGSDPL